MKKKTILRILGTVIGVLLITAYAIRVYNVNKDVTAAKRLYYDKNEVVEYEDSDIAHGYTMEVLDAKLMTSKEIYEEFNLVDDIDSVDFSTMTDYYLLTVNIANQNNDDINGESGVDLEMSTPLMLGSTASSLIDDTMYHTLNATIKIDGEHPFTDTSFSLIKGTELKRYLPFPVSKNIFESSKDIYLQLSEYPNIKLIKVN